MLISIIRLRLASAGGSRPFNSKALRRAGLIGVPDPVVLDIAAEAGRILVAHDRKTMPGHFIRFRQKRSSPGLIIVAQNIDIGAAIDDFLLIWVATEADEWAVKLGFVPV